jgi:hypothetical protein
VTDAPYAFVWSNVASGYFVLTARASDDRGATVISTTSIIAVNDGRRFGVRINFQPAGLPAPAGYLADTGLPFADRGNGFAYGWNADNQANVIARQSVRSPDLRYDTVAFMQRGGDFSWEIAVPVGAYRVRMVRGDAVLEDHWYQTIVNNWMVGEGSGSAYWLDDTLSSVRVEDGRLRVANAPYASRNNKLCFLEIEAIDPTPVVTLMALDDFASEAAGQDGTTNEAVLVVTRSGSTNFSLAVQFAIPGTAQNGRDFLVFADSGTNQIIGPQGVISIPAGQSAAQLRLVPINDQVVTGNRICSLHLVANMGYVIGAPSNAVVTLADDDVLRLIPVGEASGGSFRFRVTGEPARGYVLQVSTNLVGWLPIATNAMPVPDFLFVDPDVASAPCRFYRVVMPE